MKKADTAAYKELLISLRSRLRGDVNAMAKAALHKSDDDSEAMSTMPIHMAELGSENFEQEFTLSLMETEEDTLQAIDEALERIEEGTYGICVDCGSVIPKTRLKVLPHTALCVRCAEKYES